MVDPDRGCPSGPVAMDDKGSGTGEVEELLGGGVVVVKLAATVKVGPGVEQQPDVQACSHEAVGKVEVCKVIAGLTLILTWRHRGQKLFYRSST